MSEKKNKQKLFPSWVISGFTAVIISSILSAWYIERVKSQVLSVVEAHPSIVIVDVGAIAATEIDKGATSAEELLDALEKTSIMIERFRDEGYVVLDSRYVLDAPKDLYLVNIIKSMQDKEGMVKDDDSIKE